MRYARYAESITSALRFDFVTASFAVGGEEGIKPGAIQRRPRYEPIALRRVVHPAETPVRLVMDAIVPSRSGGL